MKLDNPLSDLTISHYGKPPELLKTIEELLELAVEVSCSIEGISVQSEYQLTLIRRALSKTLDRVRKASSKDMQVYLDQADEDWMRLLHEVADVTIVLNHVANISGHADELQGIIEKKENKLRHLLSADKMDLAIANSRNSQTNVTLGST